MEQPQYNLFDRQKVEGDYLPLYDLMGLGTTIWSPLASGMLTGKYNDGIPADSRMNLPGYEWLKKNWESEEGKAKLVQGQGIWPRSPRRSACRSITSPCSGASTTRMSRR